MYLTSQMGMALQMGMMLHPKDYCFGKMGLGVVQDLPKVAAAVAAGGALHPDR